MKTMLKTCSRCGKMHDLNHKCYANSNNYYKADPKLRKFRNSTDWKSKAEEIKSRDKYLCQICLSENIFNYKNLSVHHITPISEDWNRRLDNNNLITLCETHHRECESGKIPRIKQYELITED